MREGDEREARGGRDGERRTEHVGGKPERKGRMPRGRPTDQSADRGNVPPPR